jgi:carbamate kinase
MSEEQKTAVIAVGGNSLITDKQHEDVESQWCAAYETCQHIATMIAQGWNLVITHGNGPQVGFILRRNELAASEVHTTPMDLIGADTQGSIGYMLTQCLHNEFPQHNIDRPLVSVVTQVLVDKDDPAFHNPSKGIGGFTTEEMARRFESEGWQVVEDAGRGWRRVVASPKPLAIIEMDAIRTLVQEGFVVVAVGGGGIPVTMDENGKLSGTRAVIDKDLATGLLAKELAVDLFLISTAVPQVALNYNEPNQQWLDRMTAAEARAYHAQGHFKPGSMGPKIEAILDFLEAHPEGKALITNPPNIARALAGKAGTWVVP